MLRCARARRVLVGRRRSDVRHPSTAGAPTTTTVATGPRSIGHVFVINLENEDYDTTWGTGSPAALSQHDAGPAGQAAHAVLRHRPREPRQLHRRDQRPVAEPVDAGRLHRSTSSSSPKGTGQYGQALGTGCVYPTSVKTIADQLTAAGKTWRAYHGGHGHAVPPSRDRHRRLDDRAACRATCTRRGTTRSSTSTRSSTRPRVRRTSSTSMQLDVGPAVDRDDTEPRVHHAERVPRRARRAVRRRRARRPRLRRPVPRRAGAEDPRVAGVQGRRHAHHHRSTRRRSRTRRRVATRRRRRTRRSLGLPVPAAAASARCWCRRA